MQQNLQIQDKYDIANAQKLINLGYPSNSDYLEEMLTYMKDLTGPVAETVHPYLAELGKPLLPYIKRILHSDYNEWKYWCLCFIVNEWSSELLLEIKEELYRIANEPTEGEEDESLDEEARLLLRKLHN